MKFEFMDKRGEVIEREFRIGRAPRRVTVGGRQYVRIPSVPLAPSMEDNVNGRPTDFLGVSIDPAHHRFHKGSFHTDEHGEKSPIFRSKRDREAFQSAAAKEGVIYQYGKCRP